MSILQRAAGEVVSHGIQLRRDATTPFTRMIESQAELLESLRTDLQDHQQALVRIQGGLAVLESAQPVEEG